MNKVIYEDGTCIFAPITWEHEGDPGYKETVEATPIEVHNWLLELNRRHEEQVSKLEAELAKEREVVDFYANDVWVESDGYPNPRIEASGKDCEGHRAAMRAGKLARARQSERKEVT